MKDLKSILSKKDYQRHQNILRKIKSGKMKRWILPNTEEEFDEEVALQNFKKILKSGLIQEHQKKMKKLYGEG